MSTTLTAKFDTRRDAEMTVERLVQQFAIERTDVFIATEGEENSVGVDNAGSDDAAGSPSTERRDDAKLTGRVTVSVDVADDARAAEVRSAFAEFDSGGVTES